MAIGLEGDGVRGREEDDMGSKSSNSGCPGERSWEDRGGEEEGCAWEEGLLLATLRLAMCLDGDDMVEGG